MSLGCLMIDVAGTVLTAEERERLRHPLVGGVILFSRNFESPDQLRALTQAIGALRTPRLLIATDQEGGRVQRFRDAFTRLPPVGRLGKIYAARPGHALRLATLTGWLMARELRGVGVDLGLAPVLDLDRHTSEVIGDRAFHGDPEVVTELARAYIAGMAQAGMSATVKHFPGHGSVAADSHHRLPRDPRTLADLQMLDLVPFERLIHAGVPSIMTAHVLYPQVDDQPASFSRRWLAEILRVELDFQGAILSDDLNMAGAAVGGAWSARAARALEAGCDLLLVCNNVDGADQILDSLDHRPDPGSLVRLARLHGRPGSDIGMPEPAEAAHAVRAYA